MTDRAALDLHRRRAMAAPELFLHEAMRDEVEDRLGAVNRTFRAPAVVAPIASIWEDSLPGGRIVEDAETPDLEPGAHDLVIHAGALHWADDPVGQLIQCRRALRPDGLFLAVVPGGQSLQELRAALGQAEADITGGLSPRIAPMGEIRDLGALLQRAGFALPVADSLVMRASYRSIRHLATDLRGMGETNALADRIRKPTRRAVMDRAETIYAENFADEEGRLIATFEFIFLTGWAPDESQPQPLRPGSAVSRLADALNTEETKLSD